MKNLLNEIKAMNKIAGTKLTKEQEIALIKQQLNEAGEEFPDYDDVKAAVKKFIQSDTVEKVLKSSISKYLQKEKGFSGSANSQTMKFYDKVINDMLKF